MKRYMPYFAYLKEVKLRFAAGILAGLIFAAASGFGMPFVVKKVFPLIFGSNPEVEQVIENLDSSMGPEQANALMHEAFPSEMATREETQSIREKVNQRFGEERGPFLLLVAAALLIPITSIIRGLAGFFNTYWITGSGLHILRRLQTGVFDKLQRLPLGFYSGRKSGDIISRATADTMMLKEVVTSLANDLIKQPFTLLFALAYLVYASWTNHDTFFILICLLSVPLAVMPVRIIGKRLVRRAGYMQRQGGDNTAVLAETLGALREVRAFNLENMLSKRFLEGVIRWTQLQLKVIKYRSMTSPIIEVIAASAIAASLAYGASKGFTLQEFLPLVIALYMSYEPVKKIANMHNRFKQGEASLDRLEFILHAEEEVIESPNPTTIDQVRGDIRFDKVDFAYGDTPALRGISTTIPAGQVVALVGPSGAGKTTFASMIPRFYDPSAGQITLDDINLRDIQLKALRDHITLVPQEAVLFSGTIEDNIRLGRLDASSDEVRQAAKLANAHDFITTFTEGYDTQVGERGAQLSGGQKQRISIARAFLKNSPVLILDEATAALDADSESQIQKELADLARGRTTLIIAHRFSTIRIADRILVFENGQIAGDGTFDELESSHDLFRSLLANQRH